MATTTNYGWTTPDDTALVKDGASAIRTLGSSVDSTLKTQIDAQIPKTIVDAKGDLIAATAADTVSRLAVGTNNQVLTADSTAATGMKWATPSGAGWTQAATGSLTGASVTVSGLSGSRFWVNIDGYSTTTPEVVTMRLNGDSGSNYLEWQDTNTTGSDRYYLNTSNLAAASTYYSTGVFIELADCASQYKVITWRSTPAYQGDVQVFYRSTSAITSVNFFLASGAFDAGTYTIWKQG